MKRKLGRGVAVVGAGVGKFGAFPRHDSRDLFAQAFRELRASVDRGFDPAEVEALYLGNYSSDLFEHQGHLAPIVASWVGLTPRAALRVEDACASGGVALRQAVLAVASGLYDVVLVGGVERMTALPTEAVTDTLATAGDVLYEFSAGFTFPGFYAAMATAYAAKYGMPYEALFAVARKNHAHGALNDKAQFGMTIRAIMDRRMAKAREKGGPVPSWEDELDFLRDPGANPPVAWPLRLFDCSPITDGAAALLVVAEKVARRYTDRPLRVLGTGQASDACLYGRADLASLRAAREAAAQAYAMAGVTPDQIKLAEVHDCFTIAEVLAIEDLGLFPPGQGWRAAADGATSREGRIPVNTSGGLKAKGHPVGASGVAQVVELWKQMRGEAGPRQVARDVDLALAHNVGGTGQTCVVHILERG
ncbi:MAG: Acetyl CoA synthase (Acetyl-CoA c-acetyltransferase) [Candidatus Bipolaricaulis sibiricus]|uniref:Acetyl CoA synthase (Acetyl-CoA c-acetyltransferase) n=1 Tax=Bipolaricaulis sibiricus TaxID=2501609 RepID=A0A410FU56_BIPS1|nr:MAG: Acetyl CoA synthase (Acetyl-CoA c-acetyltransferase) [Candidatus Bipolaricaulis sibiricus]